MQIADLSFWHPCRAAFQTKTCTKLRCPLLSRHHCPPQTLHHLTHGSTCNLILSRCHCCCPHSRTLIGMCTLLVQLIGGVLYEGILCTAICGGSGLARCPPSGRQCWSQWLHEGVLHFPDRCGMHRLASCLGTPLHHLDRLAGSMTVPRVPEVHHAGAMLALPHSPASRQCPVPGPRWLGTLPCPPAGLMAGGMLPRLTARAPERRLRPQGLAEGVLELLCAYPGTPSHACCRNWCRAWVVLHILGTGPEPTNRAQPPQPVCPPSRPANIKRSQQSSCVCSRAPYRAWLCRGQ